jgi:hypothetical protein
VDLGYAISFVSTIHLLVSFNYSTDSEFEDKRLKKCQEVKGLDLESGKTIGIMFK